MGRYSSIVGAAGCQSGEGLERDIGLAEFARKDESHYTTVPTSWDARMSPLFIPLFPFSSVRDRRETTLTTPIPPPNLGTATDDPPCKPLGIVERRPLLFHSFRSTRVCNEQHTLYRPQYVGFSAKSPAWHCFAGSSDL